MFLGVLTYSINKNDISDFESKLDNLFYVILNCQYYAYTENQYEVKYFFRFFNQLLPNELVTQVIDLTTISFLFSFNFKFLIFKINSVYDFDHEINTSFEKNKVVSVFIARNPNRLSYKIPCFEMFKNIKCVTINRGISFLF